MPDNGDGWQGQYEQYVRPEPRETPSRNDRGAPLNRSDQPWSGSLDRQSPPRQAPFRAQDERPATGPASSVDGTPSRQSPQSLRSEAEASQRRDNDTSDGASRDGPPSPQSSHQSSQSQKEGSQRRKKKHRNRENESSRSESKRSSGGSIGIRRWTTDELAETKKSPPSPTPSRKSDTPSRSRWGRWLAGTAAQASPSGGRSRQSGGSESRPTQSSRGEAASDAGDRQPRSDRSHARTASSETAPNANILSMIAEEDSVRTAPSQGSASRGRPGSPGQVSIHYGDVVVYPAESRRPTSSTRQERSSQGSGHSAEDLVRDAPPREPATADRRGRSRPTSIHYGDVVVYPANLRRSTSSTRRERSSQGSERSEDFVRDAPPRQPATADTRERSRQRSRQLTRLQYVPPTCETVCDEGDVVMSGGLGAASETG